MGKQKGETVAEVPAKTDERAPLAVKAGGFSIGTIEQAYRFGQYVAKSQFYPALKTAEQVVVTLQIARDNGVTFSLVASNIAFINGRASCYGDCLIGIAWASGQAEDIDEKVEGAGDAMVATCTVKRRGKATPIVRTFSVADAKRAHLWPGSERSGQKPRLPWVEYPQRMLQMRARSWALRDAGLTQGIIAREEAEDIPIDAITVKGVIVSGDNGGSKTEQLADKLAPTPALAEPTPAAEPEPEASEPSSEPAPAAPPEEPPATEFDKTTCPQCNGKLTTTGMEPGTYGCLNSECGLVFNSKGEAVG